MLQVLLQRTCKTPCTPVFLSDNHSETRTNRARTPASLCGHSLQFKPYRVVASQHAQPRVHRANLNRHGLPSIRIAIYTQPDLPDTRLIFLTTFLACLQLRLLASLRSTFVSTRSGFV